MLLQLMFFQHTLKGVQSGEQKLGTLCSGGERETGRKGIQRVRYFQELIL